MIHGPSLEMNRCQILFAEATEPEFRHSPDEDQSIVIETLS